MNIDQYITDESGTLWSEKFQSSMASFMQEISEMKKALEEYRNSGHANVKVVLEKQKLIERLEQIQKGYAMAILHRKDLIKLINTKE